MMKMLTVVALLALPIGVSGCGKNNHGPTAEASKVAAGEVAMPAMAASSAVKSGKAMGTVTAIDAAAGKITLDHGAIPAVGWPAMTMAFSAKKDLLAGIAVGDKVDFEVKVTGGEAQVTAIKKQ